MTISPNVSAGLINCTEQCKRNLRCLYVLLHSRFFHTPIYDIDMILKNGIEQESTNDKLFVISPQAKDMI